MSQPESAERCAICGCATGDEIPPSKRCPASFIAYADETGCWKLGFERVSRALAEAEKDRDHWRGTAIRTAEDLARSADRLAEAEKELAVWRNEDAREAKYEWVSKQATAAEERAAQSGCACWWRNGQRNPAFREISVCRARWCIPTARILRAVRDRSACHAKPAKPCRGNPLRTRRKRARKEKRSDPG